MTAVVKNSYVELVNCTVELMISGPEIQSLAFVDFLQNSHLKIENSKF